MKKIILLSFILCFFVGIAYAVPTQINYQGVLKNLSGTLIENNSLQMTFSIYSNISDSVPVWNEKQTVAVKEGIYSVQLGSVNPIDSSAFDGTIKYLGVKIDTDPEMTPRLAMVSVPYAYMSNKSNLSDQAVIASYAASSESAERAINAANAVSAETAITSGDSQKLGGKSLALSGADIIPYTNGNGKLSIEIIPATDGTITNAEYATTAGDSEKLGGKSSGVSGINIIPYTDGTGKLNAGVIPAITDANAGDMKKSVYDTNSDGVVDSAATAVNATNATTADTATTATNALNATTADTAINATNAVNADTIDGIHAGVDPEPNKLYPLDDSGTFYISKESTSPIIQSTNNGAGDAIYGKGNLTGISGVGGTVGISGNGATGVSGTGGIGVSGIGFNGVVGTGVVGLSSMATSTTTQDGIGVSIDTAALMADTSAFGVFSTVRVVGSRTLAAGVSSEVKVSNPVSTGSQLYGGYFVANRGSNANNSSVGLYATGDTAIQAKAMNSGVAVSAETTGKIAISSNKSIQITEQGGGVRIKDSTTGQFYKLIIDNGALSVQPWTP